MSRPDAKKNLTTLVKAFGEDETLHRLANLVLIMVGFQAPTGNSRDPDSMQSSLADAVANCQYHIYAALCRHIGIVRPCAHKLI